MALNEETKAMMVKIKELERELTICRAIVGKRMLASISEQCKMDVPKPKKFEGTRSAKDVYNFL